MVDIYTYVHKAIYGCEGGLFSWFISIHMYIKPYMPMKEVYSHGLYLYVCA